MASSKKPRPEGQTTLVGICPARSPATLGRNDQSDPNVLSLQGDTCGPVGLNDYHPPQLSVSTQPFANPNLAAGISIDLNSGSVPIGVGVASFARIPVPGTDLFIQLTPQGRVPPKGSTSVLFIQDATGNRQLRLDYGYNPSTQEIDYHWNQKGTFDDFGIANHTPAGASGEALYNSIKYFKYGGRVLLVVGITLDIYSIVEAKKRWRQVARVAAGWAGAYAGCTLVGEVGAGFGTPEAPGVGTAVGGIAGCVVGSIAGSLGASWAAGVTYDWVEETFFDPLPEISGS